MAIALTLSNIMQLASWLATLLLVFFFVMLSILNEDFKGIVYIAGILLASALNIPLMNMIGSQRFQDENMTCNLIDISPITRFNSPAMTSLIIGFTFAYLYLPMSANDQMNYGVIISILVLFLIDAVTRIFGKCTTLTGVVFGGLVGILFGVCWYAIFHSTGADYLLYFDELNSNNVVCTKPSKQTFKCSVYKNGQLISSNIA